MPIETGTALYSEVELRGSGGLRSLSQRSCSKEPYGGSNVCLQCGKLSLASSGSARVCWNTECVQWSGCMSVENLSIMCLSSRGRCRADQAYLWDLLPFDFMDMSGERSAPVSNAANAPNLPASIGVLVFFRLLKSLEKMRNTPGILKLIRQVPSMINNTPELYLSPHTSAGENPSERLQKVDTTTALANLTNGASSGGVVDAIMSAAEGLLYGELSSQQQGEVLEAVVGLAIKRGSLAHCLRVIKLILCSPAADKGLSIPGVGAHLKVPVKY